MHHPSRRLEFFIYLNLASYVTSLIILEIKTSFSFCHFSASRFIYTCESGLRLLQLLLPTVAVQLSVRSRQPGRTAQIISFSVASLLTDH